MGQTEIPPYDSLDRRQHEVLDRIALRFEAELKQGGRPSIEAFLTADPAARNMREVVLRELLALEWEYYSRQGELSHRRIVRGEIPARPGQHFRRVRRICAPATW